MALLAALTNRLPSEVADHYRGRDPGDFIRDLRLLPRGHQLLARRSPEEAMDDGSRHVEAYYTMKGALGPPPARYGPPVLEET